MSEFEDKSWPEMHAMVAGANPRDFHDRAAALKEAADHMHDLSKQLSQNMKTVEWEGESGDAFRDWTQQLANTTSDFAEYTGMISNGLSGAGGQLQHAQNGIPKPPDTTITSDQYKKYQGAVNTAAGYIETPETNEAKTLMSALSSTYSTTATDFKAAPPVFKPLPASVVPSMRHGGWQTSIGDGADTNTGSGTVSPSQSYRPTYRQPTSHSDVADVDGAIHLPQAPHMPVGHTTLDSVPTLPTTTTPHDPSIPGGIPGDPTTGPTGLPIGLGGYPGPQPGGGPGWRPSRGYGPGGEPGIFAAGGADEGITGGSVGGRYGRPPGAKGLVVGGEGEPGVSGGAGGAYGSSANGARGAAGAAEAEQESRGSMMRPGMGGMGGLGSTGAGGKRRGRAGQRPDYVVEDEETWMTGGGTVPPVID